MDHFSVCESISRLRSKPSSLNILSNNGVILLKYLEWNAFMRASRHQQTVDRSAYASAYVNA
jgi:hypothetical protein